MTCQNSSINAQHIPTRANFQNLTGLSFDRWTVLSYAGNYKWNCVCVCGKCSVVNTGSLKSGRSKSCGCLNKELLAVSKRTHGESVNGKISAEFQAYRHAKNRCQNPKYTGYKDYGKRGIEFRFTSFDEFLNDVGRRPSPKHSLDRKDTNGHYEIGNVKWSIPIEQQRNKRNNRMITLNGQTRCLVVWSEMTGLTQTTIRSRLDRGWCDSCSLTVPVRKGKCTHRNNDC